MLEDRGVQLPYMYRVTKYDPADRDEHGHYTGTEDTVSDHGEIEAAYLQAVLAFAVEAGIERLSVREPQVPSLAHFGLERPLDNFGLEGLFPTGLTGFHDGAEVPLDIGLELVRRMLRDSGVWCRLEAEGTFAVCLTAMSPKISLRSMPYPRRNDESAAEPPSTRTTCELRSCTDEFPAPRRSVRVRPTHGRLAPCGN